MYPYHIKDIKMGHTEIVERFSVKAITLGCWKHGTCGLGGRLIASQESAVDLANDRSAKRSCCITPVK
jgi:hypothetical protein